MVLVPIACSSLWTELWRLPTVASTAMIQKIPMVMPKSDRKLLNRFFLSSSSAMRKLVARMLSVFRILKPTKKELLWKELGELFPQCFAAEVTGDDPAVGAYQEVGGHGVHAVERGRVILPTFQVGYLCPG